MTRVRAAAGQGGFALVMTLIVLVVLTLSTLAMMLVMRGGVSAAGNIAFRQVAVRAADQAIEASRTWLINQWEGAPASLEGDMDALGYFATSNKTPAGSPCVGGFAPACYDFYDSLTRNAKNSQKVAGVQPAGYDIYYVVHRMATNNGACSAGADCMFPPTATSAGTVTGQSFSAGGSYQSNISSTPGRVYYRVTVKVVGPRNNNRFIQALMY